MKTTGMQPPFASQKPMEEPPIEVTASAWKPLSKVGGVAALGVVAFLPIQIIIFLAWPPPNTVVGYFTLFHNNWLLGLLSLDLLYLVDNALLILIYLALYAVLRRAAQGSMTIALTLGLVGIASYYASNTAFEMLTLSSQYATATTDAQRSLIEASGRVMLTMYTGTAFDVYYVLNTVATLIISLVMLRSRRFGKGTASVGIVTGLCMIVPSTAGTIGLVLALLSLVPAALWYMLIARRLFQPESSALKKEARLLAIE